MSNILLLVDFPLSNTMAGPALRYFELAAALSRKHMVTLAGEAVEENFSPPPAVKVLNLSAFNQLNILLKIALPNQNFINALNQFDAVITHGRILLSLGLAKIRTKLIIDLYGPWFIEDLAAGKHQKHRQNMEQIKKLLLAGNFFLCANERQKDLYLDLMLKAGRTDHALSEKIGIVPIGIPRTKPVQNKKTLKGPLPGIAENDKVLISWGGVWDFLDALTPVNAMEIIAKKRQDIKLVVFGIKSSEKGKSISSAATESIKLAKQLGLYNRQVFFMDEWVPYAQRADYLLDADIGIISHFNNLETYFSWRTRALDYLWAGLPIVTTMGDSIAGLVEKHSLGAVVPYENPAAFSAAILDLLNDADKYHKIKQNIADFIPNLYWENLVGPIERFI